MKKNNFITNYRKKNKFFYKNKVKLLNGKNSKAQLYYKKRIGVQPKVVLLPETNLSKSIRIRQIRSNIDYLRRITRWVSKKKIDEYFYKLKNLSYYEYGDNIYCVKPLLRRIFINRAEISFSNFRARNVNFFLKNKKKLFWQTELFKRNYKKNFFFGMGNISENKIKYFKNSIRILKNNYGQTAPWNASLGKTYFNKDISLGIINRNSSAFNRFNIIFFKKVSRFFLYFFKLKKAFKFQKQFKAYSIFPTPQKKSIYVNRHLYPADSRIFKKVYSPKKYHLKQYVKKFFKWNSNYSSLDLLKFKNKNYFGTGFIGFSRFQRQSEYNFLILKNILLALGNKPSIGLSRSAINSLGRLFDGILRLFPSIIYSKLILQLLLEYNLIASDIHQFLKWKKRFNYIKKNISVSNLNKLSIIKAKNYLIGNVIENNFLIKKIKNSASLNLIKKSRNLNSFIKKLFFGSRFSPFLSAQHMRFIVRRANFEYNRNIEVSNKHNIFPFFVKYYRLSLGKNIFFNKHLFWSNHYKLMLSQGYAKKKAWSRSFSYTLIFLRGLYLKNFKNFQLKSEKKIVFNRLKAKKRKCFIKKRNSLQERAELFRRLENIKPWSLNFRKIERISGTDLAWDYKAYKKLPKKFGFYYDSNPKLFSISNAVNSLPATYWNIRAFGKSLFAEFKKLYLEENFYKTAEHAGNMLNFLKNSNVSFLNNTDGYLNSKGANSVLSRRYLNDGIFFHNSSSFSDFYKIFVKSLVKDYNTFNKELNVSVANFSWMKTTSRIDTRNIKDELAIKMYSQMDTSSFNSSELNFFWTLNQYKNAKIKVPIAPFKLHGWDYLTSSFNALFDVSARGENNFNYYLSSNKVSLTKFINSLLLSSKVFELSKPNLKKLIFIFKRALIRTIELKKLLSDYRKNSNHNLSDAKYFKSPKYSCFIDNKLYSNLKNFKETGVSKLLTSELTRLFRIYPTLRLLFVNLESSESERNKINFCSLKRTKIKSFLFRQYMFKPIIKVLFSDYLNPQRSIMLEKLKSSYPALFKWFRKKFFLNIFHEKSLRSNVLLKYKKKRKKSEKKHTVFVYKSSCYHPFDMLTYHFNEYKKDINTAIYNKQVFKPVRALITSSKAIGRNLYKKMCKKAGMPFGGLPLLNNCIRIKPGVYYYAKTNEAMEMKKKNKFIIKKKGDNLKKPDNVIIKDYLKEIILNKNKLRRIKKANILHAIRMFKVINYLPILNWENRVKYPYFSDKISLQKKYIKSVLINRLRHLYLRYIGKKWFLRRGKKLFGLKMRRGSYFENLSKLAKNFIIISIFNKNKAFSALNCRLGKMAFRIKQYARKTLNLYEQSSFIERINYLTSYGPYANLRFPQAAIIGGTNLIWLKSLKKKKNLNISSPAKFFLSKHNKFYMGYYFRFTCADHLARILNEIYTLKACADEHLETARLFLSRIYSPNLANINIPKIKKESRGRSPHIYYVQKKTWIERRRNKPYRLISSFGNFSLPSDEDKMNAYNSIYLFMKHADLRNKARGKHYRFKVFLKHILRRKFNCSMEVLFTKWKRAKETKRKWYRYFDEFERNLPNIVCLVGFAESLQEAKSFVEGGLIRVNNKLVTSISYYVNFNDVITIDSHAYVQLRAERVASLIVDTVGESDLNNELKGQIILDSIKYLKNNASIGRISMAAFDKLKYEFCEKLVKNVVRRFSARNSLDSLFSYPSIGEVATGLEHEKVQIRQVLTKDDPFTYSNIFRDINNILEDEPMFNVDHEQNEIYLVQKNIAIFLRRPHTPEEFFSYTHIEPTPTYNVDFIQEFYTSRFWK